jgi:glyoxylase-like metal-dependent hydrolase (beta-lactamase superfamily II)
VIHPAYGELRPVTPLAAVLLAPNPSPMTLEGTNTWVLRGPGEASCVVVDPGEADEEHLTRVAACGPVALVLLTHRHHDHAGGARRFAELTGAPVRALDPSLLLGSEALGDGDVVAAAGVELRVVGTPGHTSDSLSFLLDNDGDGGPAVLTGDTILGRGTTVIAHPDGALGPYLESLRTLSRLAPGTAVLPGHGPELPDAPAAAAAYLAHREQRLEQVRAALAELGADATARQVVELVYADVDPVLWPAAELSVRAQLVHLLS